MISQHLFHIDQNDVIEKSCLSHQQDPKRTFLITVLILGPKSFIQSRKTIKINKINNTCHSKTNIVVTLVIFS